MTQFDKQIVAIIPPPSTIRQKLVQKMASKVMKSLEQCGQYYETFYCRWHDDMPRERTLQCVKAVAEIFAVAGYKVEWDTFSEHNRDKKCCWLKITA